MGGGLPGDAEHQEKQKSVDTLGVTGYYFTAVPPHHAWEIYSLLI
jgi:hypothetical protein